MVRHGNQRIPRPERFRAGPLASWEDGTWKVPDLISPDDVVTALGRAGRSGIPRSHEEAWLGTELTPRQRHAASIALRQERPTSAVLVPVFPGGSGEARFILTRRSRELRSHTGEVSFPGGRVDPGELPAAAALREAQEEVSLDPDIVRLVGHLEAMPTVASGTWIVPIVGVMESQPALSANRDEVERIFDVSVDDLTAPGVYREEVWEFPGFGEGSVSFFEVEGDTIWGATARMLRNLLDLLARYGPAGRGARG